MLRTVSARIATAKALSGLATLLMLSACGNDNNAQSNSASGNAAQVVDQLYINGVIWTGAKNAADASVLAIKDGVIAYVGDDRSARLIADRTIDLEGHFVMPGFIDNHVHFFEGGAGLASVNLRDAATPDLFSTRIADYAATVPTGRWVLNGNWDHELWGGELPHKAWIDDDTPNTPVFVIRLDGHMALANSAALRLAGINNATKTPAGGEIVRDSMGEPTGILKGNALNIVLAVIPQPSPEETLEVFDLAQSLALSLGLTKIHAVTANPTETTMLDAFRLAQDHGVMKIRANVYTPIEHWKNTVELVAREGKGNDLLRWGGLKGFVDGSLGATTAWFHDPYSDQSDTSGAPLTDPQTLSAMMKGIDSAGLNIAIHAIGDKAIDNLITDMRAIAGAEINRRRYRIEHFQHPTATAIKSAASNGIIASMQPYHAIDDGRWAEDRIGADRIKTTYAFRTILDAGAILTFGSDWPVAPLAPIDGIYAAVTRRTTDGANPNGWQPREKITVEEALTAYTAANAYAGFEEDKAGTLAVGKRADFILLSDDPRTVDPVAIRKIKVQATFIDGTEVFSAP